MLSTAGIPLDKIRDILGQINEKTTLSYIYDPNTEQEDLNIMNEALKKSDKKNKKSSVNTSTPKNPLKIKGFRKHETESRTTVATLTLTQPMRPLAEGLDH